jgi:hypothetical protein
MQPVDAIESIGARARQFCVLTLAHLYVIGAQAQHTFDGHAVINYKSKQRQASIRNGVGPAGLNAPINASAQQVPGLSKIDQLAHLNSFRA